MGIVEKSILERAARRTGSETAADERGELEQQLRALTRALKRTQLKLATLERDADALHEAVAIIAREQPELARLEYHVSARKLRQHLATLLPEEANVLVASKGDPLLLELPVQQAAHFPQDLHGAYSGFHPGDDLAAIAHLEALRHQGYDTLVLPRFVRWWLEHYTGFAAYLRERYVEAVQDDLCTVFALRRPVSSEPSDDTVHTLDTILRAVALRLGRRPDVLDWSSGADLRQRYADYAVAFAAGDVLPHIDASIDVVVVGTSHPHRRLEATRVATAAVVTLGEHAVHVDWRADLARPIADRVSSRSPDDEGFAQRIRGNGVPLPVPGCQEFLVWLGEGVLLLPGALDALADTLRRNPRVGAVSGRVLDAAGRLLHAGGLILPDATLVDIGNGDWHPDQPAYRFVRRVDFCSSLFMLARREAVEAVGGPDADWPSRRFSDADFALRLHDRGLKVAFQPEAVAVCSLALSRVLALPAQLGGPERALQAEFGQRWRTTLQTRRSAREVWTL